MAYILQNTLAALLEYPGATMLGINRMLSDKTYRQKVVDHVTDPTVKSFWVDEFAKYTDRYAQEATPAIQNKVGQFTSNPLIRNIIGQPKSSFDIRKIMDEKKIFIVNLSKGLVGENNANLLGSMIVTKIYLAAMSRADADPKELKKLPNFYLYVDEFQSFANKSFADILSEARKYKLSLNITHQYIEQMAEEVRAAVFGNVGTMIAFRVGSFDAEILEKEFSPVFTMEDIVNLGQFQIYLKLMIDGVASAPFSATTLPGIPLPEVSFRSQVIDISRKNFTQPKAEVEKVISEWHMPSLPERKEYKTATVSTHKPEAFREHKEIKDIVNKIEPKIEQKPKENLLAKALQEAVKIENDINNKEEIKQEEPKKEVVSLNQLKPGTEKNRNKQQPSTEHINALKEALNKINVNKPVQPIVKEENVSVEAKKETKTKSNEVPEEMLRKILKGE
jgi:hypothetical protein